MMIQKLRLVTFLMLYNAANWAQQPLNLNFERLSVEGMARPWGWMPRSWGTSFEMDSNVVKNGIYSLKAVGIGSNQCYEFGLEPYELKGQTVSINGFIKGEKIEGGVSASLLYTKADEKTGDYTEEGIEITTATLEGSFDWTAVNLKLKIPESVVFLNLRLNQNGTGTAWFDDFYLQINKKEVSELEVAQCFSKKQINWLGKNAYAFNSSKPVTADEDIKAVNFNFLKDAVGSSRIMALGESTHGTSEFFSLKHKILQYAVLEMGFRTFALEDHMVVGENINEFVKTGNGTVLESMAGGFDVWYRAEVVELIKWVRAFNVKHPDDMVTFVGIDMQNPTLSINRFIGFIKIQDSEFYDLHKNEIMYFKENGERAFMIADSVQQKEWINRSQAFYDHVNLKRDEWLSTAKSAKDSIRILYGLRYALLVNQFFQMTVENDAALTRDKSMADNLIWYMNEINPNDKIVLWAHDVHISRGDHPGELNNMHLGRSMGCHLSKRYQSDYKSFGIFTFQGSYRAFETYAYQNLIESPLFTSPRGSIEEAMHQVAERKKQNCLFFDLDRSQDWLNERLPVRFANHVSYDYAYWTRYSIPYQFDGVFFIDSTSSAALINK